MEYTILKFSKIAGVSTRTLRYYDEIGILKPSRINSSGYRIYGQAEVNLLQQILFYKELGIELGNIKKIISSPDFDSTASLKKHRENLIEKKAQLEVLINNIDKTISTSKGEYKMTDKEKFEGFKQRMLEENDRKYGKEIREKYGNEAVEASNQKLMGMTEKQYDDFKKLENQIAEALIEALNSEDPKSEAAQKTADLHKQWLCCTWGSYSKEAHAGLANMYVEDERFKAYYDKIAPGAAELLRDAILIYTSVTK